MSYVSERDGDTYLCACGKTSYHSYLISERGGGIRRCCRSKGWESRTVKNLYQVKRPDQTWEDVEYLSKTYLMWLKAGMPGYNKIKNPLDAFRKNLKKGVSCK